MYVYVFEAHKPNSESTFDCETFSYSYNLALIDAKKYFGSELSEITLISVKLTDGEYHECTIN